MISATFFSRQIDKKIVYGLFVDDGEHNMTIHCGQDLEKAIVLYERLTEKPAISEELLSLRIA